MKFAIVSAAAIVAAAMPRRLRQTWPRGRDPPRRGAGRRVVEDRTDIAVEDRNRARRASRPSGSRGTERQCPHQRRPGRRGFLNNGTASATATSPLQPGAARRRRLGRSARVSARINLSDAPLIVILPPRNVNVGASGAVFGSVGRGASSIELGNAGCGYWTWQHRGRACR